MRIISEKAKALTISLMLACLSVSISGAETNSAIKKTTDESKTKQTSQNLSQLKPFVSDTKENSALKQVQAACGSAKNLTAQELSQSITFAPKYWIGEPAQNFEIEPYSSEQNFEFEPYSSGQNTSHQNRSDNYWVNEVLLNADSSTCKAYDKSSLMDIRVTLKTKTGNFSETVSRRCGYTLTGDTIQIDGVECRFVSSMCMSYGGSTWMSVSCRDKDGSIISSPMYGANISDRVDFNCPKM